MHGKANGFTGRQRSGEIWTLTVTDQGLTPVYLTSLTFGFLGCKTGDVTLLQVPCEDQRKRRRGSRPAPGTQGVLGHRQQGGSVWAQAPHCPGPCPSSATS